ncbi:class I SAM-dependent methyltransferase [Inquilinus limosus]|uniref:SAM-dependent methyltransferase n=1 Tax=Inquilinus limosus TaxID=171674 RepID=UPI003F15AC8F
MDTADFWAIRAGDTEFENPILPHKLDLLTDYCKVRDGACVLDIGCAKTWLLRNWALRFAIDGVGLETNPHFIAAARELSVRAGIESRIRYVQGPAAEFVPPPAGYDIVLCIGASSALGGVSSAVEWIRTALKADGVVALGAAFAKETPLPPAEGISPMLDLASTVDVFASNDLQITGVLEASLDEWDAYRSRHFQNVYAWAEANAGHSQRNEVLRQLDNVTSRYFGWQRRHMGWAIFVARPRLA